MDPAAKEIFTKHNMSQSLETKYFLSEKMWGEKDLEILFHQDGSPGYQTSLSVFKDIKCRDLTGRLCAWNKTPIFSLMGNIFIPLNNKALEEKNAKVSRSVNAELVKLIINNNYSVHKDAEMSDGLKSFLTML